MHVKHLFLQEKILKWFLEVHLDSFELFVIISEPFNLSKHDEPSFNKRKSRWF